MQVIPRVLSVALTVFMLGLGAIQLLAKAISLQWCLTSYQLNRQGLNGLEL
jgi:hypothetical protein